MTNLLFSHLPLLYFIFIHLANSLHEGRLPCMKIPMRYIFADSHVVSTKLRYSTTSDVAISHVGMPKGMRAIITIGEVNGIIDAQKAIGELGSLNTDIITIIARIIGIMIIVLNC